MEWYGQDTQHAPHLCTYACSPRLYLQKLVMDITKESNDPADTTLCEALLHRMFAFRHLPPSADQTSKACEELCTLLCRFIGQVLRDATNIEVDTRALMHCRDHMAGCACHQYMWLADYGCVLVFMTHQGHEAVQSQKLHLLGLDAWTFRVHSSPGKPAARRDFAAECGNSTPVCTTSVAMAKLMDFKRAFNVALTVAQKRKADKRSAVSGGQGHQKTPAFIAAVLAAVPEVMALIENREMDEIDRILQKYVPSRWWIHRCRKACRNEFARNNLAAGAISAQFHAQYDAPIPSITVRSDEKDARSF